MNLMTFKIFYEAELLDNLKTFKSKNDKFHSTVKDEKKWTPQSLNDDGYHKISSIGHHDIYNKKHGEVFNGSFRPGNYAHNKSVIAHNTKTGQIDMHVSGMGEDHSNGYHTFQVDSLSGRTGSTLKAHTLYHHLMTKHKHIMVGNEHTEGGLKVWQKLSQHRGLNVYAMDHHETPLNIDPHRDREDTHINTSEYDDNSGEEHDPAYPQEKHYVQGIRVIAHKKIRK